MAVCGGLNDFLSQPQVAIWKNCSVYAAAVKSCKHWHSSCFLMGKVVYIRTAQTSETFRTPLER